jgi:hypothetical protein
MMKEQGNERGAEMRRGGEKAGAVGGRENREYGKYKE